MSNVKLDLVPPPVFALGLDTTGRYGPFVTGDETRDEFHRLWSISCLVPPVVDSALGAARASRSPLTGGRTKPHEKSFIVADVPVPVAGGQRPCAGAADNRHDRRPPCRCAGRGRARCDGYGTQPPDGFRAHGCDRRRGDLSPHGASGRHLRSDRGAARLHQDREQGHRRQRRADARHRHDLEACIGPGNGYGQRGHTAHRDELVVGRRRRRCPSHREPAAQRPAVRQSRRDHPRRRPGIPFRPDQELAVLAADRRRQRPERQLSDRWRRQQRRHRWGAAATVPARSHPGIQLRHAALQGGIWPEQRRRDEHRDQERHQHLQRQRVLALSRQVAEQPDPFRERQQRAKGGLPPLSVRRIVWRPHRAEPRVLLRSGGKDPAGHEPDGEHAGALPGVRRRLSRRPSARRC